MTAIDTKQISDGVGVEISGFLGFTTLRMLDIKIAGDLLRRLGIRRSRRLQSQRRIDQSPGSGDFHRSDICQRLRPQVLLMIKAAGVD
jgi:hypothetical protein